MVEGNVRKCSQEIKDNHRICLFRNYDDTCAWTDKGCVFFAREMLTVNIEPWKRDLVNFVDSLSEDQRTFLKNWLGG